MAEDFSDKEKLYLLVEFPYPSGEGLHVGHCRSYTALDMVARKRRMEGKNVLFPIGWDAFGLPTENFAIKHKIHPREATEKNIANFRRQLKSMGFSFDWEREINTTDPKYYKWTQWIFLQLLKHGLAYKHEMPINWCPSCKIGLANEEVIDGNCERCGAETEKREISQWMLKITSYASRLLHGLDKVDYLEKIKTQQKNWIGESIGAEISFKTKALHEIIVFTTRPDTIFGATYLVLSPEHPLVPRLTSEEQRYEVETYINKASQKSDMERTDLAKDKTGVFTGSYAVNPATGKEIPIWVSDYVLSTYGTGAIMAVPAHDERDFEFARKFDLPIKVVILPADKQNGRNEEMIKEYTDYEGVQCRDEGSGETHCRDYYEAKRSYTGEGILFDSGNFNNEFSEEARDKMIDWLAQKNLAKRSVKYKLRDWVFSRQHYWGEPIPVVHCEQCGYVPVPEKDLPVELPNVKDYEPTHTGESPLAAMTDWVETSCPSCGGPAKRETDTMPNWAGSSWYFLRYTDPSNSEAFADKEKIKYWMPVDLYNGGMEHTTLHLLYSRFWYKVLYDLGTVPGDEPYQKRISHGMILGEGGIKMSKSRGNVINPDEIIERYGADTLRLYEMFMGPFDQAIPWDTNGVEGVSRFLNKVWRIFEEKQLSDRPGRPEIERLLHKTIKKVTEDIETFNFNTAVSQMMIFSNELQKENEISKSAAEKFILILSVFAPHMCEDLWHALGHEESTLKGSWPSYDQAMIKDDTVKIAVQINGRVRDELEVPANIDKDDLRKIVMERENVIKWTGGKDVKKFIYIKGKLVSIVI